MSELILNINEQVREAERAVLGGLMLETERFDTVTPIINHEAVSYTHLTLPTGVIV